MSDTDSFTVVDRTGRSDHHTFFNDVLRETDAHFSDPDLQYASFLRERFPDMIVTGVPSSNLNFLAFAAAGYASYERDTITDSFWGWRGYIGPSQGARNGSLASNSFFAKYHYQWANEDFILYTVNTMQYILKEHRDAEPQVGPSKVTDQLIAAAGSWMFTDVIYVFDGYWRPDKQLYQEVKKMSWDRVILDEAMKKDLVSVAEKFFTSEALYHSLGVSWRRGLLFYGEPGNGKTISIKALMHTLMTRKPSIPTLYVRNAPAPYYINQVFAQARRMAPCMLVLEDIETIVTPNTRSYFFNELDGLANNDGLFVIATTNFLDRLDPGLTKRPSRFDRKYLFPLPNEHERTLYCEFWRKKLQAKPDIDFPEKLCPAMAHITPGFSFAFLQECFVSTLLGMAHDEEVEPSSLVSPDGADNNDDDLKKFELWIRFKQTAELLKKQIDEGAAERAKAAEQKAYRRGGWVKGPSAAYHNSFDNDLNGLDSAPRTGHGGLGHDIYSPFNFELSQPRKSANGSQRDALELKVTKMQDKWEPDMKEDKYLIDNPASFMYTD